MQSSAAQYKKRVRAAFDRGSATYDSAATLQKDIAAQLINMSAPHLKDETNLLDLGCGTGFIGELLAPRCGLVVQSDISYRMCKMAAHKCSDPHRSPPVVADMDALPFADGSFQSVLSSMSIQWCSDINSLFQSLHGVLQPEGVVAVAFPESNSLQELHESFSVTSGKPVALKKLPEQSELERIIDKNGFATIISQSTEVRQNHQTFAHLLKSLKETGAYAKEYVTCLSRALLDGAGEHYERNFKSKAGVYCTWKIVYMVLRRD